MARGDPMQVDPALMFVQAAYRAETIAHYRPASPWHWSICMDRVNVSCNAPCGEKCNLVGRGFQVFMVKGILAGARLEVMISIGCPAERDGGG